MRGQLRLRAGQCVLVRARVAAETVIECGDLVYLDTTADANVALARPASDFPWQGSLAQTQAAFAAVFLGVAHTESKAGDTGDVSVDTSCSATYELDCQPGECELGRQFAVAGDIVEQRLSANCVVQLPGALSRQRHQGCIAIATEYTSYDAKAVRVVLRTLYA